MKTWWPFMLAGAVTASLLTLHKLGWYKTAWMLTILIILFPLLHFLFAIAWLECFPQEEDKRDNEPPTN